MFGLQAMLEMLKSARAAALSCMKQLGDDPRNAMADAMFGAFITEVETLDFLARTSVRAREPITVEIEEANFPALFGADFVRRVNDLQDLGAPLVDMLAQTADVYKKRAEKRREEQAKQDATQTVSLNRNLELVNYRAQEIAAGMLRRFACGLQDLFFPIGEALFATRLHLMTCPEGSVV